MSEASLVLPCQSEQGLVVDGAAGEAAVQDKGIKEVLLALENPLRCACNETVPTGT